MSRNNHLVTVATSGNVPAGLSGRSVSISGVADHYNGTYVVTQTGPTTLTYIQEYGDNGTSTGGSLATLNGSTGEGLSQALFVPSATGSITAPTTVSFKYSNGNLQATKTFTFDGTYVLHANGTGYAVGGSPTRALLSWPGGFGDQDEDARGTSYANQQLDSSRDGIDQHLAPKKISGGETLNGPFDWLGISDQFFAAVFLPDSPATATVATLNNQLDVSKTIKRAGFDSSSPPTKAANMPILGAAMGDTSGNTSTRIFVGPKAINVLKNIHAANPKVTLEPMLEFGFWGFIGKYLFLGLQFLHSQVVCELGLGHRHPHGADQYPHAAVPGEDDDSGAEDAAYSAADGRDQGEVQEVQGHRSKAE